MGWNCSIAIFLSVANLGAALLATAKVVEPSSTSPCEVRLPGGTSVWLPFGRFDDSTPQQVVLRREPVGLAVVLKVPVDEVIEEWRDEEPYQEEGCRYVRVGLIRLWLSIGSHYAEMDFHGPTGDVSTLLSESRAVQNRLLWVLHEAGGLAGAIIPDNGPALLLADPTVKLKIDWDWVNGGDGDPDPEKLAEQLIHQSGFSRKG